MKTDNETYSALGEVGDFQQKRSRWARIKLDLAKSPMTAKFGLLVILNISLLHCLRRLLHPMAKQKCSLYLTHRGVLNLYLGLIK